MSSSGPSSPKDADAKGASSKSIQGGGELSGLLRQSELLQRELEKALSDMKGEVVECQDAARLVTVRLTADGGVKEIRLQQTSLRQDERRALEEALAVAVRGALDRLFEARKRKALAVTKGISLPGLFN